MKKIKVYTVVCSYTIDGKVINIELNKMLERLYIKPREEWWGVDYNVQDIVKYNVSKGYRVNYIVMSKLINPNSQLNDFESMFINNLYNLSEYLNDIHSKMFMKMSDKDAEIKLRNYGNDYSKQIKGGM